MPPSEEVLKKYEEAAWDFRLAASKLVNLIQVHGLDYSHIRVIISEEWIAYLDKEIEDDHSREHGDDERRESQGT